MHKPQESSILYILNIAGSAGSKMLMNKPQLNKISQALFVRDIYPAISPSSCGLFSPDV